MDWATQASQNKVLETKFFWIYNRQVSFSEKGPGAHQALEYSSYDTVMFMELNSRSPGEKDPWNEKKPANADSVSSPDKRQWYHLIISNYNCVSFSNVFYADIQVANEAGPCFIIPIVVTCWA